MSAKVLGLSLVIGAALGKKYISTFDSAEKKVRKLGGALKETNKKLGAANAVTKYKNTLEQLKKKQQELGRSSPQLERGIADLEKRYKKAKREAKSYGLSIGDITKQQKGLDRQSKKLGKSLDRLARKQGAGAKFANQKGKAVGLLGGAYAAGRVLSRGANFEHQLQAFANVGGLDDKQKSDVEAKLQALSSQVNQHKSELLSGVDYLVGKGLDTNKSVTAIGAIGKAATATLTPVTELAAASFSMIDNMEIASKNIGKSLDLLASSGKQGGFELKDMAQFLPVITAQAKQLGLVGREGMATLGASLQIAMKGAGDPSVAANNFQNFLAKITSKETVANLGKLGVSVRGVFEGAKAQGLDPVVAIVKEIEKLTGGDAFKLNAIFGDMQVKNFINPLLQNMDEFEKIRQKSLTATSVIDDDFNAMMDTANEKGKKFVIGMVNIGDALSNSVMPAIKPVLTVMGKLSEKMAEVITDYPVVGQVLGVVATSFAVVTAGAIAYTGAVWLWNTATVGAMVSTVSWTASLVASAAVFVASKAALIGGVVAMKGITAAQWLWNVAMTANPIGLLIAGVATLAAGAALIYAKWEPIKRFFSDIGDSFGSLFGGDSDDLVAKVSKYQVKEQDQHAQPNSKEGMQQASDRLQNGTQEPAQSITKDDLQLAFERQQAQQSNAVVEIKLIDPRMQVQAISGDADVNVDTGMVMQ